MTDEDGTLVYNSDYLPFGTRFAKDEGIEELHGFTGKEFDPDTGLYYFNARWYDSELGRFLSEDPAADPKNPNLYSYCGNNPLNRVDPSGEWWNYLIAGAISGLYSQWTGGTFYEGFLNGVITYAIASLISEGLGDWAKALKVNATEYAVPVASGALAGGIVSAANGGDFWEGAGQGALTNAVAWKVNKYFDENFKAIKGKNQFGSLIFTATKGAVISGLTGGDPLQGAFSSAGTGLGGSIVDKFKSKVGTLSTTEFDENNITEVIVLNDTTNVFNEGHTAILYIDANGNGMYLSYNPIGTTAHGPGQMRYQELNPAQTTKLLKTGQIGKVNYSTGAVIRTTTDAERPYDRFMRFNVTPDKGSQMFEVAREYWRNPGTYDLLNHNCSQVVSNMLDAGGISYPSGARPNVAFNKAMLVGEYQDIWRIINRKITNDFYKVYGDMW